MFSDSLLLKRIRRLSVLIEQACCSAVTFLNTFKWKKEKKGLNWQSKWGVLGGKYYIRKLIYFGIWSVLFRICFTCSFKTCSLIISTSWSFVIGQTSNRHFRKKYFSQTVLFLPTSLRAVCLCACVLGGQNPDSSAFFSPCCCPRGSLAWRIIALRHR